MFNIVFLLKKKSIRTINPTKPTHPFWPNPTNQTQPRFGSSGVRGSDGKKYQYMQNKPQKDYCSECRLNHNSDKSKRSYSATKIN